MILTEDTALAQDAYIWWTKSQEHVRCRFRLYICFMNVKRYLIRITIMKTIPRGAITVIFHCANLTQTSWSQRLITLCIGIATELFPPRTLITWITFSLTQRIVLIQYQDHQLFFLSNWDLLFHMNFSFQLLPVNPIRNTGPNKTKKKASNVGRGSDYHLPRITKKTLSFHFSSRLLREEVKILTTTYMLELKSICLIPHSHQRDKHA